MFFSQDCPVCCRVKVSPCSWAQLSWEHAHQAMFPPFRLVIRSNFLLQIGSGVEVQARLPNP